MVGAAEEAAGVMPRMSDMFMLSEGWVVQALNARLWMGSAVGVGLR